VALARALARRPGLLLLDEPLAALDRKLREETQFELMRLQRELDTSFVVVTHDQDEAMVMADRIAVMRAGRIEQLGPPRAIYDAPANRWVAGFIGEINLFEATVEASAGGADPRGCRVRLACEPSAAVDVCSETPLVPGQQVAVAVRPERIVVADAATGAGLAGTIVDLGFRGDSLLLRVRLASGLVVRATQPNAGTASGFRAVRGEPVAIGFGPDAARVLTA
jgi:putrescine transport system ATP-binding protein